MSTMGSARGLIRSGAGIAVAMGVMNLATYGFVFAAARLLGPVQYGAVASLMGLLLVVNVLSLGLQATAARRIAAAPDRRDEIERSVMAATYRSALVLGAFCAVLTPVITWTLALGTWHAALMIAMSAVPLTIMGGQAGILQGEQRWRPLAGVYLGMGLARLLLGVVLMILVPSAFGAMLAVAIGAWVPAVVGGLALGHTRRRDRPRDVALGGTRLLREVGTNSHALLAFFALSNLDVVLARALFPAHEAGLYAGGLILTKAVLFLPQFVVVVAFPSMASSPGTHRMYLKGLVLVAAIGVLATSAAALLGGLAVTFVGGAEYAEIQSYIWVFAALGTLLAMIQLMVYEILARQDRRSVLAVWVGLLAVAAVASLAAGGLELVRGVTVVQAMVLVVLLATTAPRRGRSAGDDTSSLAA